MDHKLCIQLIIYAMSNVLLFILTNMMTLQRNMFAQNAKLDVLFVLALQIVNNVTIQIQMMEDINYNLTRLQKIVYANIMKVQITI